MMPRKVARKQLACFLSLKRNIQDQEKNLNGNVLFICADTIEFMIREMLRSEWSYLCTILTELRFSLGTSTLWVDIFVCAPPWLNIQT